jgi:demethylmenaquinone methyltransferase/2-methoxy-6-polyprenyl-1,4-benzoquinol methylase
MAFFGFWLSHVPAERLSAFLNMVRAALKPCGRLFLVDSQRAEQSTSTEQDVVTHDDLQKRILNDGRQFEIVKIYYDPAELSSTLRAHGFDIEARATPNYFIYADGVKAGG